MTPLDLAWAAGLLEGEGWFGWVQGYPALALEMTDQDVVEKFAALFPGPRNRRVMHRTNGEGRLDSWRYQLQGAVAIGIMLSTYTLLGERRRRKIETIVTTWRDTPYYERPGSKRVEYKGGKRRV